MNTWNQDVPLVEVVVLDWEDGLEAAVERLLRAGIDVVLVAAGGQRVGDVRPGPGRAFVWRGSPPQVSEIETRPGGHRVPPAPADSDPVAWATRWLAGPHAPATVVRGPTRQELDEMAAAGETFPAPVGNPSWRLDVGGIDRGRERDVESWFTVANGRSGTRGAVEEAAFEPAAGFYVAGVYGKPSGEHTVPELVRGPEWTRLMPCAGREDVDPYRGELLEHRRILDFRQGTLLRHWYQGLPSGDQWRFRSARFASQADRDILALEADATCDDCPVTLATEIPLPHGQTAVESVEGTTAGDTAFISVRPNGTNQATLAITTREQDGHLERIVALERGAQAEAASRPRPPAERGALPDLRARHRHAWRERWRDADVAVEAAADDGGDLQRALRFALYHLISSGDPESDLASIGARALTGPGYGGRVFWDTEIFVLPFFIWTHPATARALLSYRHRTLPAAREKARRFGYEGALYAWESADTGEEATPEFAWLPDGTRLDVLTGLKEHHISADVAWAVWQYWLVTGDDDFLRTKGAAILVETARFWASRAERGDDGRLHIPDVIGPDEYHERVDDNAYTNGLARWNLLTAACLPEELTAGTDVRPGEADRWREVAQGLVDGFDPATGLFEQFAGFFGHEDVRAVDLAPRPFTGEMVLGVERLHRSQVIKQADVVMLAHLLPDVVPADIAAANYRYYEPRTSHGSSLSPAIHAAVAARLGLVEEAEQYFRIAAFLDLDDKMGNAAHGVHVATMGGLWQAATIGFGGVRAEPDCLRLNPQLPPSWQSLAFSVRWRGTRAQVEASPAEMTIHLDGPASIALGGTGTPARVGPGPVVAKNGEDGWTVTA